MRIYRTKFYRMSKFDMYYHYRGKTGGSERLFMAKMSQRVGFDCYAIRELILKMRHLSGRQTLQKIKGKSLIKGAFIVQENYWMRQIWAAIRESDGRGRHTTTARHMYVLSMPDIRPLAQKIKTVNYQQSNLW